MHFLTIGLKDSNVFTIMWDPKTYKVLNFTLKTPIGSLRFDGVIAILAWSLRATHFNWAQRDMLEKRIKSRSRGSQEEED